MKLPTDLRFIQEDPTKKAVLQNLFEHYLHDMAEWFDFDTGEDGRYAYPVETCWEDEGAVFIAYSKSIPIGFALVAPAERWTGDKTGHDLKEFFVVRRYRRSGVGLSFATHLWARNSGPWLVRVYQGNLPALPFWRRAVASYAKNDWSEETRTVNGKNWSYFQFRS